MNWLYFFKVEEQTNGWIDTQTDRPIDKDID